MNVYTTDKIRNVVLLGHGGCGKTSLVEAMAYLSGITSRMGKIDDGNTVSDFGKEEQKRHISIATSVVPIEWEGTKINVLDSPGFFDFVGEVEEAVSAADAAIIVVSGKAGVEVGTEKAWEICEKYKLPRMFFVTEMDVDDASFRQVVEDLTEKYGKKIAPHFQPIRENEKLVAIPVHTLFGDYPPKIPEDEIKPMDESGEIVLSRVVIPEYIIVHDGVPSDYTAQNYYVRYRDYIKNVVSSEIYATWPENAIYANTLAIMSFTLNRVYTEWYRNKGYNFTITSSTAYDQKWIRGRNIYKNIDRLVDSIFANYLSRPGVRQPIFTSYCDGRNVTCNGLSQWGSKYLGDEGYSPIQIIRYYYGSDMYINTAVAVSGVPSSWPGYNLNIGASGDKVLQIQQQLNRIAQNYPAIPRVTADGVYGPRTAEAVRVFQSVFNLPANGIVDYPTWYKISEIYVGVSRIAEPG